MNKGQYNVPLPIMTLPLFKLQAPEAGSSGYNILVPQNSEI